MSVTNSLLIKHDVSSKSIYNNTNRKNWGILMPNDTEKILSSALCVVLHHKNIDKITVKDIVTECDLTRQTFYNHFNDVYDLVEFSAGKIAKKVLDNTANYDNWQKGFYDVMILIKHNKKLSKNVYESIYRDVMGKYTYEVIYNYIIAIVDKQAQDMDVAQKHKDFIAHFYSLAFIAIILEWVHNDMKEDPQEIVAQIGVLVKGDFQKALKKYAK